MRWNSSGVIQLSTANNADNRLNVARFLAIKLYAGIALIPF